MFPIDRCPAHHQERSPHGCVDEARSLVDDRAFHQSPADVVRHPTLPRQAENSSGYPPSSRCGSETLRRATLRNPSCALQRFHFDWRLRWLPARFRCPARKSYKFLPQVQPIRQCRSPAAFVRTRPFAYTGLSALVPKLAVLFLAMVAASRWWFPIAPQFRHRCHPVILRVAPDRSPVLSGRDSNRRPVAVAAHYPE